jgi:hypothetical protein
MFNCEFGGAPSVVDYAQVVFWLLCEKGVGGADQPG